MLVRGKKTAKKLFKSLRSIFRHLKWLIINAGGRIFIGNDSSHRVMVIYDTTRQPFAIGDFLVVQIAALINCRTFNAKVCDIAIIYNQNNPASSDRVFSKIVGKDNVLLQITSLMSILTVNPCVGSIFLFNSAAQAEESIKNHFGPYKNVFPRFEHYINGTYLNDLVFNDLIYPYYSESYHLPKLEPTKALKYWAHEFMAAHVGEFICVTVNIRNNPNWGNKRNSHIEEWKIFFEYCVDKFPVKFIIICSKNEINKELSALPNVIFAKEHHTEVDQELALIAGSQFHMGTNSGPAAMAYFGSKPYFIFGLNIDDDIEHQKSLNVNLIQKAGEKKYKFIFAKLGQTFTSEPESFSLLLESFLHMLNMTEGGTKIPFSDNKRLSSESRYSWMR